LREKKGGLVESDFSERLAVSRGPPWVTLGLFYPPLERGVEFIENKRAVYFPLLLRFSRHVPLFAVGTAFVQLVLRGAGMEWFTLSLPCFLFLCLIGLGLLKSNACLSLVGLEIYGSCFVDLHINNGLVMYCT